MSDEYEAVRKKLYTREGIEVNKRGYIEDFEEIFFDFSEL